MASSGVQHTHNSETIRCMALALDRAWELLPAEVDHNEGMRQKLATFIIDHFDQGEHDPTRLSDLAVAELDRQGRM